MFLEQILGFDVVKQGLTLKNTINATGGVTSTAHRFWGTASNADKLGGVSASNYVQTGTANFSSLVEFSDFGIAIGDSNDLVIKIVNDDKGLIANEQGQEIFVQVQDSTASQKMPIRIESGALLPGYDNLTAYTGTNVTNIGSTTHGFGTVYATTFSGSATSSQTLDVGVCDCRQKCSGSPTEQQR